VGAGTGECVTDCAAEHTGAANDDGRLAGEAEKLGQVRFRASLGHGVRSTSSSFFRRARACGTSASSIGRVASTPHSASALHEGLRDGNPCTGAALCSRRRLIFADPSVLLHLSPGRNWRSKHAFSAPCTLYASAAAP